MVDINNLKKVLECAIAANLSGGCCGATRYSEGGNNLITYTIEAQKLMFIVDELIKTRREISDISGSYEILKDAYENIRRRLASSEVTQ